MNITKKQVKDFFSNCGRTRGFLWIVHIDKNIFSLKLQFRAVKDN